jgi:4-diphosphocytidyl-2-C-methyl-D-erythritol kinase
LTLSAEPVFSAEAPAKINRELRVGRLRPDGFHEIRSRIVSIDLADTIDVAPGEGLEISCEGFDVPSDESNLVVRAARALAKRIGRAADARIRLTKRIPVGAGLGGGSSDAAQALLLLSRLWDSPLPPEELHRLAAAIGSDVPFFLVGGEADVAGRGEVVVALPDSPGVVLLLLVPPFPISTGEVYAARRRLASDRGDAPLPSALDVATSGRFFGPNDLAFAVLQTRREMGALVDSARSLSSETAITGSGSAIVLRGPLPDAAERLRALHPEARLEPCRTLSRGEYRLRTAPSGGFNGDHSSQSLSR